VASLRGVTSQFGLAEHILPELLNFLLTAPESLSALFEEIEYSTISTGR